MIRHITEPPRQLAIDEDGDIWGKWPDGWWCITSEESMQETDDRLESLCPVVKYYEEA